MKKLSILFNFVLISLVGFGQSDFDITKRTVTLDSLNARRDTIWTNAGTMIHNGVEYDPTNPDSARVADTAEYYNETDPVFLASDAPKDSNEIYRLIDSLENILNGIDSIRQVGDTTFFYDGGSIVMAGIRYPGSGGFDGDYNSLTNKPNLRDTSYTTAVDSNFVRNDGTLATNRIAYVTGTNEIGGSANFTRTDSSYSNTLNDVSSGLQMIQTFDGVNYILNLSDTESENGITFYNDHLSIYGNGNAEAYIRQNQISFRFNADSVFKITQDGIKSFYNSDLGDSVKVGSTWFDETEIGGSGSGAMTAQAINDSINFKQVYDGNDTITLLFGENYYRPYELTNDTIVIDMTNAQEFATISATFFNKNGTDTIAAFVTTDGSPVKWAIVDSFNRSQYLYNTYIVRKNGSLWTKIKLDDTLTADTEPLYALSAEIGTQNDSLINIKTSKNITTTLLPQGDWNVTKNYTDTQLPVDTVYKNGDTIKIQLIASVLSTDSLKVDYTEGDTLIYGNDSILHTFTDTSVTNNVNAFSVVWGTYQNATIDNNSFTATSTECRTQADGTMTGDFTLTVDIENTTQQSGSYLGFANTSGLEAYLTMDFVIYCFNTDVYVREGGAGPDTDIGNLANGSKLRINRTGTTVIVRYASDGINFSTIFTSGNSYSGTQYFKAGCFTNGNSLKNADAIGLD